MGLGASTLFWFDRWAGDIPFAARFLDLFSFVVDLRIFVEDTLIYLGHLAFRRPFGPLDLEAWHELLD